MKRFLRRVLAHVVFFGGTLGTVWFLLNLLPEAAWWVIVPLFICFFPCIIVFSDNIAYSPDRITRRLRRVFRKGCTNE